MVKHALHDRDPEHERLNAVRFLGFGGLIPFWALVFFQFFDGGMTEQAAWDAEMAVVIYGAVISSFMGGGRWVFRLLDLNEPRTSVFGGFFFAVFPPLLAWVVAAAPDMMNGEPFTPLTRGFVLSLILLFQLVQEFGHRHMLPGWYLDLRIQLTAGAVGALWMAPIIAGLAR